MTFDTTRRETILRRQRDAQPRHSRDIQNIQARFPDIDGTFFAAVNIGSR